MSSREAQVSRGHRGHSGGQRGRTVEDLAPRRVRIDANRDPLERHRFQHELECAAREDERNCDAAGEDRREQTDFHVLIIGSTRSAKQSLELIQWRKESKSCSGRRRVAKNDSYPRASSINRLRGVERPARFRSASSLRAGRTASGSASRKPFTRAAHRRCQCAHLDAGEQSESVRGHPVHTPHHPPPRRTSRGERRLSAGPSAWRISGFGDSDRSGDRLP
jgi:hypothetical protein